MLKFSSRLLAYRWLFFHCEGPTTVLISIRLNLTETMKFNPSHEKWEEILSVYNI